MKKLLAILPALALVTACTSTPIAKPDANQVHVALENAKSYTCDNNARILAVYGKDSVNVRITAPTLNLDQVSMILKQDASASGTRYIAQTPDSTTNYDFRSKGDTANLTVNYKGTDYPFSCQLL